VFDTQPFDVFPCSTANGLRALGLLRAHGYSVMPNTARSVENVIEFCNSYGLPGGIAEHGCIFIDRVAGREEFLFGPDSAQELARCRAFVEGLPGLTCDPGYRAAVRFFQHRDGVLSGFPLAEARELLHAGGFSGLDVIATNAETFFLPKGVNKGTALAAVRGKLPMPPELVVAIGDSDQDLEMLRQADLAYVPANGSACLRESIRSLKKVHLVRQARQQGMLAAVEHLIREAGSAVSPPFEGRIEDLVRPSEHIIDVAIEAGA
jgi:trehalose-6-phosphatase